MKLFDQMAQVMNEPLGLTLAVASPNHASMMMLDEVVSRGVVKPVLVGSKRLLNSLHNFAWLEESNMRESDNPADMVCRMVKENECDLIMKGDIHTDELFRALIQHKLVKPGRRITHLYAFQIESREPLFITDPSIAIQPDLNEKIGIIENAVEALHVLGIKKPSVALLSSVERANVKIASSMDAVALTEHFSDCADRYVWGPLALDNAISVEAATAKGVNNEVAGKADLLVVPTLDAGNMLAKALVYLAGFEAAGLILGTLCPVVFTSRSASKDERLRTLQLSCLYIKKEREKEN